MKALEVNAHLLQTVQALRLQVLRAGNLVLSARQAAYEQVACPVLRQAPEIQEKGVNLKLVVSTYVVTGRPCQLLHVQIKSVLSSQASSGSPSA